MSLRVPHKAQCRLLVDSLADKGLTNAQISNAREIVLRLSPEQFHVAMFHQGEPDERIRERPNTELVPLPQHRQSSRILHRFLMGSHDILFYLKSAPAARWYMAMRGLRRDRHIVVGTVESRADIRKEPTVAPHLAEMWEKTVLRADYLFSNSNAVKESLQREYGLPSEVIPTGVDTKFFRPGTARARNLRPVVLFVGSLWPFKQAHVVLNAAGRFPDADFVVAGGGMLSAELQSRTESERLTNVSLLGSVDSERLRELYQQADVFLFPSSWEGSPKVILEAAACGLPVIARRVYEPETVVDGRTGYLVSSDAELYARLRELLQSCELRTALGSAARQHAETFDWDRIAGCWAQALLRVMETAQSR